MYCIAEFIDGVWDSCGCGCEDCRQAEYDAIEHQAESGAITDAEARALHASNGDY